MRYLILLCNPFPQKWCLAKTTISGSVHFQALSFGFSRKPSDPPVSDKFSVVTVEISFPVGDFICCPTLLELCFPLYFFFFFFPKVSDLTPHIDMGSKSGVTGFGC